MKHISIFILLAAFHLNASAQKIVDTDVPTAVKNNFKTMFNKTVVTSWELEDGNYEANYMQAGVENTVVYATDGKLVQYENPVTARDIPEAAITYLNTNCVGKKIGGATKIKTITGLVSFEVEVDKEDYLFDSNGNFIKKEEGIENDED